MRFLTTVIVLLALLVSAITTWADSIDDAEAKRRGVAVEVVQLEHAKERIASLEKQVADLQARNAKLQRSMPATTPAHASKTAPASAVATKPAIAPEIAAAVKDHKLVKGMTVADTELALGVKLRQIVDSSMGTTYRADITEPIRPNPNTGAVSFGTEYTIIIRDGVISDWNSTRYFVGTDGLSHNRQ